MNADIQEEFRPIQGYEGYEGLYEISNYGRVRTIKTNKMRKPVDNLSRCNVIYKYVVLSSGGKVKGCPVHRLVAIAFIPNPDGYPMVNHIDSNPSNNHVSNLEWCTNQQNMQHASERGRLKGRVAGEKHPMAKLTEKDVIEIRQLLGKCGIKQIAEMYNVTDVTIYNIKAGNTWCHI